MATGIKISNIRNKKGHTQFTALGRNHFPPSTLGKINAKSQNMHFEDILDQTWRWGQAVSCANLSSIRIMILDITRLQMMHTGILDGMQWGVPDWPSCKERTLVGSQHLPNKRHNRPISLPPITFPSQNRLTANSPHSHLQVLVHLLWVSSTEPNLQVPTTKSWDLCNKEIHFTGVTC